MIVAQQKLSVGARKLSFITGLLLLGQFLASSLSDAEVHYVLQPVCHAQARTELYQNEILDRFPCAISPSDLSKLRKIWVVGETHQWALEIPNIESEQRTRVEQAQLFWEAVEHSAREKELFLLVEGETVSRDGSPTGINFYSDLIQKGHNAFGIEDSFAYSAGASSFIAIALQGAMISIVAKTGVERDKAIQYLRFHISWAVETLWASAHLQSAWRKLSRPLSDPQKEAIARQIDDLLCQNGPFMKIEGIIKSMNTDSLLDLVGLLDKMNIEFAKDLANYQIHQVPFDTTQLASIMSQVNTGQLFRMQQQWSAEAVRITSTARDILMAANTAKLYCASVQTRQFRPLVLRVGRNHQQPLIDKLRQMARASGLSEDLIDSREPVIPKD